MWRNELIWHDFNRNVKNLLAEHKLNTTTRPKGCPFVCSVVCSVRWLYWPAWRQRGVPAWLPWRGRRGGGTRGSGWWGWPTAASATGCACTPRGAPVSPSVHRPEAVLWVSTHLLNPYSCRQGELLSVRSVQSVAITATAALLILTIDAFTLPDTPASTTETGQAVNSHSSLIYYLLRLLP